MRFRCPPEIQAAVKSLADEQMISLSAYIRRAVARCCQADGAIISKAKLTKAEGKL